MEQSGLGKCLAAEWLGTMLLVATVVGSGIMAETLAGGNVAVALLGNTIATGAILVVLITILGPLSGAHFQPGGNDSVLVTRRDPGWRRPWLYRQPDCWRWRVRFWPMQCLRKI